MTENAHTRRATQARRPRLLAVVATAALALTGCTAEAGSSEPTEPAGSGATVGAAPSVQPSTEPSTGIDLGPVELVALAQDAVVGMWWGGCRWSEQRSSTTGWSFNEDLLLTSDAGLDLEPQLVGTQGGQDGELASELLGGSGLALVDPAAPTGELLVWRESVTSADGLVALGWSPERNTVTATPLTARDVEVVDGEIRSFATSEELEPWLVGAPVLDPGGQVAGIVTQETMLDDTVTTRVLTYAEVEADFVELVFASAGPRRSLCSLTPSAWTYRDDDDLDDLWDDCTGRGLEACDELAERSEEGSDYHFVGVSCGGLGRPTSTCVDQTWPDGEAPVFARGQDGDLDALWRDCVRDDLVACDQLSGAAPAGSSYARAAGFCGWTTGAWTPGTCTSEDPDPVQEPPVNGGLGQDDDADRTFALCLDFGGIHCDWLWDEAVEGTIHHDVALTCGMRETVASAVDRRPCVGAPAEEPDPTSTG